MSVFIAMFIFANVVRLIGPIRCTDPFIRLLSKNLVLKTVFVTASCIASPVDGDNVVICNINVNVLAAIVHLFNSCPRNVSFTVFVVGKIAPLVGDCVGPGRFKKGWT